MAHIVECDSVKNNICRRCKGVINKFCSCDDMFVRRCKCQIADSTMSHQEITDFLKERNYGRVGQRNRLPPMA